MPQIRPDCTPRTTPPEFRQAWRQFDQLAGEIDPHLYEVVQVEDDAAQS